MATLTTAEKLAKLRDQMTKKKLDAYVISDSDPHQSEYPVEHWRSRSWFSGFSGSAGTLVVTGNEAGLWTDSRYYLEAEETLSGSSIRLFRDGAVDVPTFERWIADTLEPGDVVGFDDQVLSVHAMRTLQAACREQRIEVRSSTDLLDPFWDDRPGFPSDPIYLHDVAFAGRSVGDKLADVRGRMKATRSDYLVTAALDEIAWVFNIRGSDVPYNPVFLAYAVISEKEAVLFVDDRKISDGERKTLVSQSVQIRPYHDIMPFLAALSPDAGVSLWPLKVSVRLFETLPKGMRVVETIGPISRLKAIKNMVEKDHLRAVMIRDAVALERFFYWLDGEVSSPGSRRTTSQTELSVAAKLREFRARDERFVGESFETIAGYRGHGAIVHYGASPETDATLKADGLLLVDSGGQYLDGTTDITRVVPLGRPTEGERKDYTLVLKAHIALAAATFPKGTTGQQLDTIARDVLWRRHLAYGHGTGHGVGFFLNVHEGPHRIGTTGDTVELEPGMYTSNEPGLYREGQYGIRIENLVLVQADRETDFGEFYSFETITLCHLEPDLVDPTLLDTSEKAWFDAYQRRVFDVVAPFLSKDEAKWLQAKTRSLSV